MLCIMASIHRSKGRANWYCAFTDAAGKRRFRSTGVTDRSEAKLICNNMELAVREARRGSLSQKRARALIEGTIGLIIGSSGESHEKASTQEFIQNWISDIKTKVAVSTFESYSGIVKAFLSFLGKRTTDSIARITVKDIRAYRDSSLKVLSTGTVNCRLRMLNLIFDSAIAEDLMDKNPARSVGQVARVDKQTRRPFTDQELRTALSAAPPEWQTAIFIGYYTGLRLGDVANLKWENVDLRLGEYSVKTQKTGRQVINALAAPLLRHLGLIARSINSPYLLPGLAKRATNKLSIEFNGILAKAGLIEKTNYRNYKAEGRRRKYSGLSFHCLRHTTTSALKNTGTTSAIAGDIVGHDSEAISRNYTKIDTETKREALNRLPDITTITLIA